jgi:hypothetical protein
VDNNGPLAVRFDLDIGRSLAQMGNTVLKFFLFFYFQCMEQFVLLQDVCA